MNTGSNKRGHIRLFYVYANLDNVDICFCRIRCTTINWYKIPYLCKYIFCSYKIWWSRWAMGGGWLQMASNANSTTKTYFGKEYRCENWVATNKLMTNMTKPKTEKRLAAWRSGLCWDLWILGDRGFLAFNVGLVFCCCGCVPLWTVVTMQTNKIPKKYISIKYSKQKQQKFCNRNTCIPVYLLW